MVAFLEKMMDWALNKEAELAKNCEIAIDDIEKQIEAVEEKRKKLREKFEEEDAEFGHVLDKLHFIKAEAQKCQSKKQS